MSNVFYFIAQNGCISNGLQRSNFYSYTIPEIRRGEVIAEVEQAKLGDAGLEYPAKFLEDLKEWDEIGRRIGTGLPVYTAERLMLKHGGSQGQHPTYRLYVWQQAVADNQTRLGYWQWVEAQVNK